LNLSEKEVVYLAPAYCSSKSTSGQLGHSDAALEQKFFHVAIAESEAIGEPDPVADDFPRKAVVLVAFAGGGRGHV
jgi:hypothetical protein